MPLVERSKLLMEANVNNQLERKSGISVRTILKGLSFLCAVLFFCPSFLVSCSGEKMSVNAMTGVVGVSDEFSTYADPHPILLICLIIPLIAFVALFIKKLGKGIVKVLIACMAVDLVIWLLFRSGAKTAAENWNCSFSTTIWFYLNIASQLLILILSLLVVLGRMQLDVKIADAVSKQNTNEAIKNITNTVNRMSDTVSSMAKSAQNMAHSMVANDQEYIGFCQKCGTRIPYGNKFCVSCGTPVPEDLIIEAEEAKREAEEAAKRAAEEAARKEAEEAAVREVEEALKREREEAAREEVAVGGNNASVSGNERFCTSCGAKIPANAKFCMECGAKVE